MFRRHNSLLAAAFTLALAPAATADLLPFQGTLELHISTLDPVGIFGIGTADVSAGAGGAHLTAIAIDDGVIATDGLHVQVTDPGAFPIMGLVFTVANGAGDFAIGSNGRLSGPLALRGVSKVCLFGTCSSAVANIDIPLSVIGEGGAVTAQGAVNVTVRGAPWTTGAITLPNSTVVAGVAKGPAGNTSSTAQLGGLLSVVTPIFISTNIAALSVVPAYGRIIQRFTSDASPPRCQVDVAQQSYQVGELVRFTTIRFFNPNDVEVSARLRLDLDVPDAAPDFSILDSPATLPAGFDTDVGPVDAFPVVATLPIGTYVLRCRVEEQNGFLLFADEAAFQLR